MRNTVSDININKELFYYEKLKEIKHKKKSSPDFDNYKKNFSSNYGAHLANQKSISAFDGAEGAEAEQSAEEMPDTVARGEEGGNYEQFNRLKSEALERAKKTKGGAERAAKVAKAAQQLKNIKNIKNLLTLVKAFAAFDPITLLVTWVIMNVQFIGGNIFKSKKIPPLGGIELLIYIPVAIFVFTFSLPMIMLPLITTGLVGGALAGIANIASSIGTNIGI
ncbi:MAG: hypothetical protein WC663_00980 [Patescibacteria group bacterium]|jgi:hypothetical protein